LGALSALGTIFSSLVALYLARKNRQKIKIEFNIGYGYDIQNLSAPGELNYALIGLYNNTERPLIIRTFYLEQKIRDRLYSWEKSINCPLGTGYEKGTLGNVWYSQDKISAWGNLILIGNFCSKESDNPWSCLSDAVERNNQYKLRIVLIDQFGRKTTSKSIRTKQMPKKNIYVE